MEFSSTERVLRLQQSAVGDLPLVMVLLGIYMFLFLGFGGSYAAGGGIGFGAGGGGGGGDWVNFPLYAGGNGADGIVYIEWD